MKKGINVTAIITSAVAVCLVAVIAVLGFKIKNSAETAKEPPESSAVQSYTQEDSTTAFSYITEPEETEESSTTAVSELTNAITTAQRVITTTIKQTIKSDNGNTVAVVDEGDVTVPVVESTKKAEAATIGTTVDPSKLPQDMYFSGLYQMGYDTVGPKEFIYNDDVDPNCMQANFGYNSLYDVGANLIDFSIETVKIDFKYNNKSYRYQLWKGQYISGDIGTVGGEVGIYVRYPGKSYAGSHYDCAKKEDWLYMEMTVLWDEEDNGVYKSQFTRKYALHWWDTGFVDGQLKNRRDSNSLKILNRITCPNQEYATLLVNAMVNKGFKKVSTFDPTSSDTVKQYGNEVIYIWHKVR